MPSNQQTTFGPFRLDPANERLWRDDQVVALRPKPFAVLKHLLEHRGQLVTKQQLLDSVWPSTFVTDAVQKDSIRQLREALGDAATSPRYIETAHRRGYRFIGHVLEKEAAPAVSESGRQVREYRLTPSGRKQLEIERADYGRISRAIVAVLDMA